METPRSHLPGLPLREIRSFLTPIWMGIHRSDLAWHRSTALPNTPSYAMCRHATAFLKRLLLDADRKNGLSPRSSDALSSRYRVVRGRLDTAWLPDVPEYMRRDPRHFVLMDDAGDVVDITADQFGLDPLSIRPWSAGFDAKPEPYDPGLAASAREWARHPAYGSILSDMKPRSTDASIVARRTDYADTSSRRGGLGGGLRQMRT